MERLQKLIAQSGLCSRRKAETLISEGRVKVNGEVINTLGSKASYKDTITVDGRPISIEEKEYYVFYKPEGTVSTVDDEKNRQTVVDFIDTNARIFPVGRLDYDTSGLLLLTNDGDFTEKMIHPSSGIQKEYEVTVEGFLRKPTSRKVERGVKLDGEKTKPAKILNVEYNKEKETTKFNFIITEGKYRHIRRLFENFEHPVTKLKRVRFGSVDLGGLSKGEVRILKPHELKQLHVEALHNRQKKKKKK